MRSKWQKSYPTQRGEVEGMGMIIKSDGVSIRREEVAMASTDARTGPLLIVTTHRERVVQGPGPGSGGMEQLKMGPPNLTKAQGSVVKTCRRPPRMGLHEIKWTRPAA